MSHPNLACRNAYTNEAARLLYRRYFAGRPEMRASIEERIADFEIARGAYRLRKGTGLTRSRLAARAGVAAEAVQRIEEARYEGDAFAMLGRIAAAAGKRVVFRIVPKKKAAARRKPKAARKSRARRRPSRPVSRRRALFD